MMDLAGKTSTGVNIIPMTDEQKFILDLKGWLLIPGVLNEDEAAAIREHVLTLRNAPESLDPLDRYPIGGPAEMLLDHPVLVGILNETLAPPVADDCYGFRCENSFYMVRSNDETGLKPHGGGMGVGPLFTYQYRHGRIYTGLTRVVWELDAVGRDDGGTLIMSGTHKMNYPIPAEHTGFDSPLFDRYECPPGSLIVFSEALNHAGPTWKNPDHPRVAIFNCYSPAQAQFHKLNIPHEVIDRMPAKRRTLFRGVWGHDFDTPQPNNYYDVSNKSL
jgi:hypothetical protein